MYPGINMRFTVTEDSAMPEGNMSAVTGLREAVSKHTAFSASQETDAINSGVRGRAPAVFNLLGSGGQKTI